MGDSRSLTFALAGTFVLRCASYGAGIIIPVFLGLKSHSDAEVTAWLAALVAVTFYGAELVGAPIFGALSDRHGRKLYMLLGPIFGGVAIQMLGMTSIIPVLIAVRVLEGLSTASSAPATLGFLSSQTAGSERLRGRVMGFYEAATVVGLASGAAVGGQLYDRFGTLAFTLVALIYVVALLLFLPVRDTPPTAAELVDRPKGHGSLVARMMNRRIMRFAPAWLAANAVIGAWFSVGPFLASGIRNPDQFLMGSYRPGQIGMAFMLFGIVFTAGAIAWGFAMPRLGRQATLMLGVGGLAWATLMAWIINQNPPGRSVGLLTVLFALLAAAVFIQSGFTPAALAYLAEIAEEQAHDRGAVMGVYSVLLSVGQLLGGALAAPFAQAAGMNGLIALTTILTVVAGITVFMLGRAERREEAARSLAARLDTSSG